jgi:DNA repair protein RecN (Recombination protein N)
MTISTKKADTSLSATKRRAPKADIVEPVENSNLQPEPIVRERTRFLRLTIENFGLIDRTEIEFAPGFTVFSGETGSGKTMVLGAIALVLGERVLGSSVRRGAERARITLEFRPEAVLRERCEQLGVGLDPGEDGVIVREISAHGRSSLRVNGRPATAAQLRELMSGVVELVGQHEQQRLLVPSEHLLLLDRFGGPELLHLRTQTTDWFEQVRALEEERDAIRIECDRDTAAREAAEAVINDIANVDPLEDEDVMLKARRDQLQDSERILRGVQIAHEALAGEEDSASARLSEALAALRTIERYGAQYAGFLSNLTAVQSATEELMSELGRSASELTDADPAAVEALLERLENIERLKRRYGGSIANVRIREREARDVLDLGATRDDRLKTAERALADAQQHLRIIAHQLTAARTSVARRLERAIEHELHGLAMVAARFVVQFEPLPRIAATGAERVAFLLAANKGIEPASLAQCASGGELSRILLACILVLASDVDVAAVVFDEIDAGIGGATGTVLGERLTRLARHSQVLCVTHLAQIASFAERHVVVQKGEHDGTTTVVLEMLETQQERITEIARMLSGDQSEVARKHAASLLTQSLH